MNIISAIMDLDPAVQGVIGAFVLFAASFGWILSLLGGLKQLSMGWTVFSKVVTGVWGVISKGFTALWGVMSTFITWVAGALGVSFGAALAIIVGVIALIVAVVLGAIDAWKNNFLGFKDAVKGVWEAIKTYIDGFVTFWKGVWDVIVGIFTLNGDKISSGFTKMGEGIKNMFRGVGNFVINIFNGILSLIIATLAQVVRLAQWVWNKIPGHEKVSWYEDIISAGSGKQLIPSFKTGGIMENTGLAYLHAGEQVIPKNEVGSNSSVNFAPVININASTNASASDISRTVSEELNRQWASKFQRSTTVR
jgi:phage-related protein